MTSPYYKNEAPAFANGDFGVPYDYAPDYALHVRRAHELIMRLSAKTRTTAVCALLAVACLAAVPWQADDAASIKLAALFNNKTATAALAVASAVQNPASLPATLSSITTAATANVTVVADAEPAMTPVPDTNTIQQTTLALNSGQTLSGLLQSVSIVGTEADAIAKELRTVFDIRRLKAGQKFNMVFKREGEKSKLVSMNFADGPTKEIKVERQNDGSFDANAAAVATSLKRLATHGKIEGSLYDSAADAGLPVGVMRDVVKIFSHAIDFQRDIKRGDGFEVMYDQRVTEKGDKLGDGNVIFASIEAGGKALRMYRYEYQKGQFDYFDENGRTAKRGLLRTPVDGARMTSGFGMRMHPLLGYSKMHEGIDFGAGAGTPIYAAGDGVIEQMGWNGSYGKFVLIRHNGRLQTAYAHASGFGRGLSVGSKVKQGQVIAYVGSTGRSTGAHLHYEVRIDKRQVNPMSVNVPTGKSLSKAEMVAFKRWKDQIQNEFKMAQSGVNPLGTKVAAASEKQQ